MVGVSASDSARLQELQKRCLRVIGAAGLEDLDSRRRAIAIRLFNDLPLQDTFLKRLQPAPLPSGRRHSVLFCSSSLRRSSFFPKLSIILSSTHCD